MPERRILYVSRWYPDPPDNGSRLRAWGQLTALAVKHEVTLVSFTEPGQAAAPSKSLLRRCRRVVTVPSRPFQPDSWGAYAGYLSPMPRSLSDTFSPEMHEAVEREVAEGAYDLAVAATLDMTSYAPPFGALPWILDDLEIGVFAERRHGVSLPARVRAWLTWTKLTRHLRNVLPRFRACTVSSPVEARLLARVVPGYRGFQVIENAVDAHACAAVQAERRSDLLVFAGSLTYEPNLDAMLWFCGRVLPSIRAAFPRLVLAISGALPRETLREHPGVRLVGHVDDVRALVASAVVSVAPIRLGGGTRVKILEAMALGTPVVATAKAAEGLDVVHGEHLLIAEEEEVFAAQVVRLLRDTELRRRLARAARVLVESRYDTAVVGRRLDDLVESVVGRAPATAGERA